MIEDLAEKIGKEVENKSIKEAIPTLRSVGLTPLEENIDIQEAISLVRVIAFNNLEVALFLSISIPFNLFLSSHVYSCPLSPGGKIIPFADISDFLFFFDIKTGAIDHAVISRDKVKFESIKSVALPLFMVNFDSASISEKKLGEGEVREEKVHKIISFQHILILASCVGALQKLFTLSLNYSRERKQGGKPIVEYYAIKSKLLSMRSFYETYSLALRELSRYEFPPYDITSLYLGHALSIALRLASEAIQIHGGYGYMKDFKVEKIFREILAISSLFSFHKTWAKIINISL